MKSFARKTAACIIAVLCALWQLEWAAVVYASMPQAAMTCSCRGATQCCCLRKAQSNASARHQCGLKEEHRPQAQCRLEADDCSHGQSAVMATTARESLIALESAPVPLKELVFALRFESLTESQSVALDPPLIPPRNFA